MVSSGIHTDIKRGRSDGQQEKILREGPRSPVHVDKRDPSARYTCAATTIWRRKERENPLVYAGGSGGGGSGGGGAERSHQGLRAAR